MSAKHLQFVRAARDCLGTPFVHQGRLPGVGLDCAGLVVHAGAAVGITFTTPDTYPLPARPEQILQHMQASNLRPTAVIEAGAVLLFRLGGQPQHLAIASSMTHMIHAYAPAGRVVETHIGEAWLRRSIGIYSFTE